jgi:uncharacterized surface protein with fasciclin (FAS1) repeats
VRRLRPPGARRSGLGHGNGRRPGHRRRVEQPAAHDADRGAVGQLNPNVNLVDTLNGGEFTVFAPTDDAFGKIPPATIDSLKTASATLTKILTYHVVPGRVDPANVVGTHKTVECANVTVTGSPDALKVNNASVARGEVNTANATVYLIDTVPMPPAH